MFGDARTGYIPTGSTDYRLEADRPAWEQKAAFFTTPARKMITGVDRIGHLAVYIGSGQLLHTYRVGIGVTVTALDDSWSKRIVSAKRVIN